MVLVTLNIPPEIKERLQLEPNQSKLITDLLRDYFLEAKDIDQELAKIKERKEGFIKMLDIKEEKLRNRYIIEVEKKKTEEDINIIKEDKRLTLINNCIKNTKDIFDIDLSEAQAIVFIDGNYDNIKEYIDTLEK